MARKTSGSSHHPPGGEFLRRVAVLGVSGSGKTTLGSRLAAHLGVPHVELDALHWEADWIEAPDEVMRQRVEEALAGPGWVADGNYAVVRDLTWDRADTLVWLDYSLVRILWQLTRRILRRCLLGERIYKGNQERLWTHLATRDSLYLWVFQSRGPLRRRYLEMMARPEPAGARWVRLRSPGETRVWLASLGVPEGEGGPGGV